ncbi:tRNA epoxyqueuosine(34) reductase QueG [Ideonella livida]|uniref:Epoxyqueuosine reductase n=1 Tax=Ideonella livida TaxID=2707176 RepID=A0A7C9PFV8_9BURK|nr:tRNA epoxyqueuosine(34) reductase QueG [Ideonella livida]NDY90835.1 tRNA epoxyqueuosine(34) reductase QueG [Ideonella livida]
MVQGQQSLHVVWERLQRQAHSLGFSQIGVAGVDLSSAEPGLLAWLDAGFHGSMGYMAAHGLRRARPAELLPGTVRVITARMDYLPAGLDREGWRQRERQDLARPDWATVSLYARGRDYHKVLRQRLQKLADALAAEVGPLGARVFTDSAPVLEVELALRSQQGWRGKHTLLLNRQGGSMFFLGEIYVDLPLPLTEGPEPDDGHCGQCSACLPACPTGAIVAPYRLDARRCISYLTIEHAGPIPLALRPLLGNRVYGCDDCQLACPWNKFAQPALVADFTPRPVWADRRLPVLWAWREADFLRHTEGSPIRRIGFARWRRNLAVVSGNALAGLGGPAGVPGADGALADLRQALRQALGQALADLHADDPDHALVAEHLQWALSQGLD